MEFLSRIFDLGHFRKGKVMENYKSPRGDSGVERFELRPTSILIEFKDGSQYLYDHRKPGQIHVDEMKRRARAGQGLTTYINTHVRKNFARQLK